jgi:hypothetical protein
MSGPAKEPKRADMSGVPIRPLPRPPRADPPPPRHFAAAPRQPTAVRADDDDLGDDELGPLGRIARDYASSDESDDAPAHPIGPFCAACGMTVPRASVGAHQASETHKANARKNANRAVEKAAAQQRTPFGR